MLANISSELSTIQNGRYGEDIRTAIKEAIRKVNDAGYMPVVENLNVNANGTYTPSAGVNGFSKVVVNVPTSGGYPEPTGTIQITENGIANVKDYASANVNVQPSLQSKTVTENGTVTPDTGYDGLSSVVVNVSGGGGGGEPLPMTVTASSTFSQSPKQPSGIFGDVAGNFWGSNGTDNWLNINFATPFNLKKVRLSNYYRASATTYWYSSNIAVRASNDGFATYIDLYTGTGLAQSDTQFEIDLNNSDAYIEYRFIVSDTTAYAGLGRVELSGETAILLQSKTVTQNGIVTPDDGYDGLSSVVVNVQGGGQSGGEHLIPSNPGAEIINNVGVIISSNALGANGIDISGYEYSAGYEGMNVTMYDLTAGQEYDVSFDFQSTDAGFFSGQYTIGYKVSATRVSSYPTSSTPDSSYTAFTRDLTVNTCSTRFTATAESMYIIFAFVGYSDNRTNYFTISKLKVTEVSA